MDHIVPVTAQWALRGKEAGDYGYRLLDYSAGTLGPEDFESALMRYSPGELEFLPQVTIGHLSGREGGDYLAIAVYDRPAAGSPWPALDQAGREIVHTRCYCVPVRELAVGPVTYQAMYDGLRGIRLPVAGRGLVSAGLAVPRPRMPDGATARFATRAAALLLTGRPVCILGARQLAVEDRLVLLDAIVSLLPYGIRSQVPVSTWVGSTYAERGLRLFFSGPPGLAGEHVMTWGEPGDPPVSDPLAARYLAWLRDDIGQRITYLARETEAIGFSLEDVSRLMARIGLLRGQETTGGYPPRGRGSPDAYAQPPSRAAPAPEPQLAQPLEEDGPSTPAVPPPRELAPPGALFAPSAGPPATLPGRSAPSAGRPAGAEPAQRAAEQAERLARRPPPQPSRSVKYDDLVDAVFAELVKPGRLMFNPPEQMKLDQAERVEVRIARTLELDAEILRHLSGSGTPRMEEIRTAPLMTVSLDGGDGFRVTAYSAEEQRVARDGITTWEFDIRAVRRGLQRLVVTVDIRVPVSGQPLQCQSIGVREAVVYVRVGKPALVLQALSDNWQWLIGTVIAAVAVVAAVLYH